MVEMTETANILNNATPKSLVILDEIGRGTSTFDGISLAWAITEHIHDAIGCRTLFATHYHELVELEKTKPGLRNANVAVRESEGEIVFLHQIVAGGADQSYGIHVARLAGVPEAVTKRADILLKLAERNAPVTSALPLFATAVPEEPDVAAELCEALERLDPDKMSPREALAALYELRGKLMARRGEAV